MLLRSITYSNSFQGRKPKDFEKKITVIEQFANMLKKESFLQQLFQVMVCCTWEDVHNSLQCLIGLSDGTGSSGSGGGAEPGTSNDAAPERQRPALGEGCNNVYNN